MRHLVRVTQRGLASQSLNLLFQLKSNHGVRKGLLCCYNLPETETDGYNSSYLKNTQDADFKSRLGADGEMSCTRTISRGGRKQICSIGFDIPVVKRTEFLLSLHTENFLTEKPCVVFDEAY